MAELNEGSLSKMLEGCKIHEEKKKKTRSRPPRHLKEKRRGEQREKMIKEKEGKRDAEREEMVKVEREMTKGIGSIKNDQNRCFAAYCHLEVSQTFLPDQKLTTKGARELESLSRKMVRLLRWDLPSSGLSFRKVDGSVNVAVLARYFRVKEEMVEKATSSDVGKGKRRMIVIEERVVGTKKKERRIAALGGHGFAVQSPPGHKIIEKETAGQFAPLVHETDARAEIERSGYLSAMHRAGGINFTIREPGGYRPKANTIIAIHSHQLVAAIETGLTFFHNPYSGLVFGVGKQNDDGSWDGKIPLEFLTIF